MTVGSDSLHSWRKKDPQTGSAPQATNHATDAMNNLKYSHRPACIQLCGSQWLPFWAVPGEPAAGLPEVLKHAAQPKGYGTTRKAFRTGSTELQLLSVFSFLRIPRVQPTPTGIAVSREMFASRWIRTARKCYQPETTGSDCRTAEKYSQGETWAKEVVR